MSASGSLFTATITLLDVIPARCWIAPEIPSATYRSGVTVFPVCPTCSSFGRQPASVTAREAPTAPPSASASCSTRCQFSGPLRRRPPDTTTRASPAEARRKTRAEVAAVQRGAREDEVRRVALRLRRERRDHGQRAVAIEAGDLDHTRLAEGAGLGRELERHPAQLLVLPLGDDEDLHRTFASSRSNVASCSATAFMSPSFRIFPPPRAGGVSSATISSRGPPRSAPSEPTGRSGVSFFFAFIIPASEG